jgi:hypothetical protein
MKKSFNPIYSIVVSKNLLNIRRKVSFKKKLSIAEISYSSEVRLTEKGEKGISFMQKSAGVMEH